MATMSSAMQNTFKLRIESLDQAWADASCYVRNRRYDPAIIDNSEMLVGLANTTFGSVANLFMLHKGAKAPSPHDDVISQALLISDALKPALA